MQLIEIIRAVLLNMKENKFRVFLTSLGIIVGSFTIIMVVGIGKGSEQTVAEQFKRLTVDSIMINKNREAKSNVELTLEDVEEIEEQAEHVKGIAITLNSSASVTYGTDSQSVSTLGVNQPYFELNNLELETGDFFSENNFKRKEKVIILGYTIAENWFGENVGDAIGEKIVINGRRYQIIGVLKFQGSSGGMMGGGPDEMVYTPYEVAQKYFTSRRMQRTQITAYAVDIDSVSIAMEEIKKIIDELTNGNGDSFDLRDAGKMLESATESARTMSLLLTAVACIVLIVGGIGIMNVLFVSVKERTKEIGILKSIGASRRDILLEFLLESIMISITGGVIGSILSIIAIPLMGYTGLRVISSGTGIFMGLAFSIITGTFFGYYPALKASQLKPIDALNYE